MEINKIYQGDSLEVLKTLEDESVNCCITSPPYWGLRDYGIDDQIGLEKTPQEYVDKMVLIFKEVRRVLKKDGILWLNLGDSYAGMGKGQTINGCNDPKVKKTQGMKLSKWRYGDKDNKRNGEWANRNGLGFVIDCKPKDLVGIPWMVAFALRTDGWYLRQDIIWAKPNPMPESVTDRCTKSHEYIFLLSKSQKYYFDQESIKEDTLTWDLSNRDRDATKLNNTPGRTHMGGLKINQYEKANKRDVWTVNTSSFKEAHFATFPEKLIVDMIKAGCPKGGVILDPFMGAGTTGLVARKLERHYVGIELNPKYIAMAEKRIRDEIGLFY